MTVTHPLPTRTGPGNTLPAAAAVDLHKTYGDTANRVVALDGVDVAFPTATFTAIMGPSGSGKSTLMHCLAGLDTPTSGQVLLGNLALSGMPDVDLTKLRRDRIGFVFQAFNLLPMLTAAQNITLPVELAGGRVAPQRLAEVAALMGLSDRLEHRPSQLSGGQQQRTAIARALVGEPAVVFADEPTGNLDSNSGAEVLGLLRRTVREYGRTVIMVTHDPVAASYADRVVLLADGRIAGGLDNPTPDAVLAALGRIGGAA